MLDAALAALIRERLTALEVAALQAQPYTSDPELGFPDPEIDWDKDLPYDGRVPAEVLALARQRRRARTS
jgi:hypothetical protein